MRYRLRTLLIVIAVLAAVLARVAYLKRQRDFHRQEANRLATQIATFQNYDVRDIREKVRHIGTFGPTARGSTIGADLPGKYGSPEYEDTLTNWHLAHEHEILANRYSRAIYRPWALVWDDPNSVPDQARWVDIRVATYSAILAVAMLAAWKWWPKTIVSSKAEEDHAVG
ncbi:MAG TPA: hypothetical protein VGI40_25195 [Pirellulaceae bacterium]|jgi:hypothetical protein